MKTCYRCNAAVADQSITCPACGAIQPLNPPIPPPVLPALPFPNGKVKPAVYTLAGVYCILIALTSFSPVFMMAAYGVRLSFPFFINSILPNLLNLTATAFLAVMFLKRTPATRILFTIWSGIFLLSQIWAWQQVWNGWHIFRARLPLLLWAGINLILILLFFILLFTKRKTRKN